MYRDYPEARMLRQTEPYAYQRSRNAKHWSYPRPAQANTSQPNQRPLQGWGMTMSEYWSSVFKEYLERRKSSSLTNLALGRR